MTTYNRFKQGASTYVCRICNKRTRETGYGEESVELCRKCMLECELENAQNDYGDDSKEAKRAQLNLDEYKAAHK